MYGCVPILFLSKSKMAAKIQDGRQKYGIFFHFSVLLDPSVIYTKYKVSGMLVLKKWFWWKPNWFWWKPSKKCSTCCTCMRIPFVYQLEIGDCFHCFMFMFISIAFNYWSSNDGLAYLNFLILDHFDVDGLIQKILIGR